MGALRRSRQQWEELIEAFSTSGQTLDVFCAERGLNAGYFQKKRTQLRRKASQSAFIRAQVNGIGDGAAITVQIQDVQVRCSAELPPEWIAELAVALRT